MHLLFEREREKKNSFPGITNIILEEKTNNITPLNEKYHMSRFVVK